MRTFSTHAERQIVRDKIIKKKAENRRVLTDQQSFMKFIGRAHDEKDMFSFVAPYKGFISNLMFDDSRLYKYTININVMDLEGNITSLTENIGELVKNARNTVIEKGHIVNVQLPHHKGINHRRDIRVTFLFNQVN